MKETLYGAFGRDQTRVKRAFRWVITFRDFPVGSTQTVDGDSMMTEALTLFTKGRAEFYLDGERRADRVPGILSSEYEPVGLGGEFELRYVEPTTRVCIPRNANSGQLPHVKKHEFDVGGTIAVYPGQKFLVCVGSTTVNNRTFTEEQSFQITVETSMSFTANTLLLEFL